MSSQTHYMDLRIYCMEFNRRVDSEVTYLYSAASDCWVKQDAAGSFVLYQLFERIWKRIEEQYSSDANSSIVQNEYAFLRELLYFDNKNEGSFKMENYLMLINDYEQLRVSKASLNLLLNRWFFKKQFKDTLDEYDNRIKKGSTWSLRRLLSAHCLGIRYRIGQAGQFTYNGERFVIDNTIAGAEQQGDNGLLAVRFRQANTFSSINSLRLIEKIFNYIKKIENEDSPSSVIKVAAFGHFSDQNDLDTLWLEQLSRDGYFTDKRGRLYSVNVTSFELKQLTEFRVMFEEHNESEDASKLAGNLLDPDFLYRVCKKYEVVCLMDMGCLYRDTNRFEDARGDTPYEAVRARSRSVEYVYKNDGVDGVVLAEYNGLYNAYIKWIESHFYGKKHSYEFDARVFSALTELKEKLRNDGRSTSVYSFMSKDRGTEISSKLEYRNLCKGEYYEGRPVIAYDWSPAERLSQVFIEERNTDIFTDAYSERSLFPIRLWKIIKSLGDYFYTERFTGLMIESDDRKDSSSSNPDFDFVRFAKETFLTIDYSKVEKNKLSLAVQYFPTDVIGKKVESEKFEQYLNIAKNLAMSAFELAFDPDCYEPCASGYCRSVIVNAMITDGVGMEHILLAKKLEIKPFLSEKIEVDFADDMNLLNERPRKEHPTLYSQHQIDNLAISTAIWRINRSGLVRFDSVVEVLEEMLPRINDSDGLNASVGSRLDCAELLHQVKSMCEKISYTDCQLYRIIR